MPIEDGEGSKKESKFTAGKTIEGYFSIKSPGNGTWRIVYKVADNTVVDQKDVVKGDKVPFKAKTKLVGKTEVKIQCYWSEKQNTTLKVHMHATY